jgi:hypothetical protein
MHNISSRRESFSEFHNLLDYLLKDEEKFWRYFRMSSDTFKYVLELIHTSIKEHDTNFRRSSSPEERLMVTRKIRRGEQDHNCIIYLL